MKILGRACLLFVLLAAPAAATDQMPGLSYLVGIWNCTYHSKSQKVTYVATYSYALGNNWMRVRDKWTGGGGDEALITYVPKEHAWTTVIFEEDRTTTIFHGVGGGAHIAYKGVYPSAGMAETFERVSSREYTVHFNGTINGQTITSVDTCIK
jgi:hypothetical protein